MVFDDRKKRRSGEISSVTTETKVSDNRRKERKRSEDLVELRAFRWLGNKGFWWMGAVGKLIRSSS